MRRAAQPIRLTHLPLPTESGWGNRGMDYDVEASCKYDSEYDPPHGGGGDDDPSSGGGGGTPVTVTRRCRRFGTTAAIQKTARKK